jgi:hypothetical protein
MRNSRWRSSDRQSRCANCRGGGSIPGNVGNGIGRLHPNIGDDHVDFLTLEVLQSLRRGWSFAHLAPGVLQVFRA